MASFHGTVEQKTSLTLSLGYCCTFSNHKTVSTRIYMRRVPREPEKVTRSYTYTKQSHI